MARADMTRTALSQDAVRAALSAHPGWRLGADGRSIARDFTFPSFAAAFAFMTRAALFAEKIDHHPDWSNSFRRVRVNLTTHVAGGLTELDFAFAAELDRIDGGAGAGPA